MTSATFFPTRWPASTYGPGLHNHEIHSEQSSNARGWSAARTAIHLQTLYKHLHSDDTENQSFVHHDGNVFALCDGLPLPYFLDSIEAKYRDVSMFLTMGGQDGRVHVTVLSGRCAEELVPGSQNRGLATQFSWAFRWAFAKSKRKSIGRACGSLLEALD